MLSANVQLVVPASLHQRYPAAIRPSLQTLESFMGDIRLLNP
ncbi:MAG: type II restriction endonuclease [Chloroflexi bacterium]|nr:type II restriction endonuclease [Chloroflexota bacterium]